MNTMTVPLDAAALAQRAAAGGNDFFRYHGVWSPGVRLFRNLRFKTKALVVSISFGTNRTALSNISTCAPPK